jgi:hypothetical protein
MKSARGKIRELTRRSEQRTPLTEVVSDLNEQQRRMSMRRALLFVTLVSSIVLSAPATASERSKTEPCADIPLERLLQQAAPKSTQGHTWRVPTISQHAEIADKATCSSITEPLATIRPDESRGLDDRFCQLLRSELARRGSAVTEGRSSAGNPGDTDTPNYTSCTLFSENSGQTFSVQAIYMLQADHSTRVMVTVSAW